MFDDPERQSRAVLKRLLAETAAAFGSEGRWLHVGGDEASAMGKCTNGNIADLEHFVAHDVVREHLGLTAVGWEELRLKRSEPEEARRLADVFFGRLEALFAAEAGRHIFDNHSMTLVLRRS